MTAVLALLGFLPFVFGGLLHWFMISCSNTLPPLAFIGIVTLLIWAAIAFSVKPYIKSTKKVVIGLNLVAFVVLILLGIQELIFQAYWLNFVGMWTQLYYLPLVNISVTLISWSRSVFSVYCVAFLLMVIATLCGCKLRKKN